MLERRKDTHCRLCAWLCAIIIMWLEIYKQAYDA